MTQGIAYVSACDFLLLVLLGAIWGASFLFIRVAAPVLGPIPLMDLRVIVAAAALLLYSAARRRNPLLPHRWRDFVVLGTLNNAIPFVTIATAELVLTASLGAILNATSPFFTVIVAAISLRARPPPPAAADPPAHGGPARPRGASLGGRARAPGDVRRLPHLLPAHRTDGSDARHHRDAADPDLRRAPRSPRARRAGRAGPARRARPHPARRLSGERTPSGRAARACADDGCRGRVRLGLCCASTEGAVGDRGAAGGAHLAP